MKNRKKNNDHTNVNRNIPFELTSFIGRKHELTDIKRLITSNRLVTLTGVAGCGKTRVALRLASDVSPQYLDGTYWISLAALTDQNLLAQTVAKSLNIATETDCPQMDSLIDSLRDKRILLIFDNCEHLLGACAVLVKTVLENTAVSVLVTSREPLQVVGELLYPMKPMAVPPYNIQIKQVETFDAIQLFVERVRSITPSFELTDKNANMVVLICQKLDGIPLAIELASARTNILSLEQIATRLDKRFGLLSTLTLATLNPHQTLRSAIDWSYDLLTTTEQTLLQSLSVFRGGCSLTTVERVCSDDTIDPEQIIDLLSSLVNKSLVTAQTSGIDEARYSLLEMIREYGQEKLIAFDRWKTIKDQHLLTYLEITEETEPKLLGQYQQLWLNWLEREFDNIRAALTWAVERHQIETGLRIAIACYQFWTIRDYSKEGLSWYERLLPMVDETVSPVVRANALSYAANMSGFRGNIGKQIRYGRDAVNVAELAGDAGKHALKWALVARASGARAEGDFETEFALAKRSIQINREIGDSYDIAVSLSIWSFSAMSVGAYGEAHAMLDESLPTLRELGNPYRVAMALNFSGDLARCEKDYEQAKVIYEESISILRDIDAMRDLASVLHNLGHVYLHLGQDEKAQTLFTESMSTHRTQGNKSGMAECLIGFAALAINLGDASTCLHLLTAIPTIRRQPARAMWAATLMDYQHYLLQAIEQLSQDEVETEQAIGRALSLEQALSISEKIADKVASSLKATDGLTDLSDREIEIVKLIAQAKSNGDIADELVLSKRTVEKHIANIRSKLGFTKRTEIVRWAIDKNLLRQDQ